MSKKSAEEYETLREELLVSQKIANTVVLSTTTISASLFIVGIQATNSMMKGFAFLMPQVFVIFTLAHLRRRGKLADRLACYIAVFHEMSNGGGWELYSRCSFLGSDMDIRNITGKWRIPKGIYTTHGFLTAVMLVSAGLLVMSESLWPWKVLGIILPILSVAMHLYFERKNKNWQHKWLLSWHRLKKIEEEKTTDWIFQKIIESPISVEQQQTRPVSNT